MEEETGDDCVPPEALALLSDERLILRETGRAVTPFGGVTVFVAYLRKVNFVEKLRQCMPICWRSPNQIEPGGHVQRVFDGGVGGRKTVCPCQLAARRSSSARVVRDRPLPHGRHDPQSVPALYDGQRAALVRTPDAMADGTGAVPQ